MNYLHFSNSPLVFKESQMLKRFLLAVAALACCSSSVFAQADFFLSFANDSLTTESELLEVGDTTTAFIFSRDGFDFVGAQFAFGIDDTDVGVFTDGEFFLNSGQAGNDMPSVERFIDGSTNINTGEDEGIAGDGGITGAGGTTGGFGPGNPLAFFDPAVPGVGNFLGTLELTATGAGEALVFIEEGGPNGILARDFSIITDTTTIGGGGITLRVNGGAAAVPEPTSAGLLAMGLIGLVARRRR